jgi:hypothetical protein
MCCRQADNQHVRHTVTVVPVPCAVVIEVVRSAANPGVSESDVIRWVGVFVAVAGIVLATPDGIASSWCWVKDRHRRAWAIAGRLLRRPGQIVLRGGVSLGRMSLNGKAYAHGWQPWQENARATVKIDILHHQVNILLEQINELRIQIDRSGDDLRKEIREAEGRVTGQVRQLALELSGERSQASRVDARGLGPIALGIIMTGLPDELATVAVVGWLTVAGAVIWIVGVSGGWLRDYRQALESTKTEDVPEKRQVVVQ